MNEKVENKRLHGNMVIRPFKNFSLELSALPYQRFFVIAYLIIIPCAIKV